jgi:hypothetical protein
MNGSLGYDVNELTNNRGEAYFLPLVNNSYQLQISASGYQTASTSVNVNGATVKDILLAK